LQLPQRVAFRFGQLHVHDTSLVLWPQLIRKQLRDEYTVWWLLSPAAAPSRQTKRI
jgi:hypothetical protein